MTVEEAFRLIENLDYDEGTEKGDILLFRFAGTAPGPHRRFQIQLDCSTPLPTLVAERSTAIQAFSHSHQFDFVERLVDPIQPIDPALHRASVKPHGFGT